MKLLKKLLVLALAAMMVIGATACKGRNEDDLGNSGTGSSGSEIGGYEGVENDYAEGVTISTNGKEVYFGDSKEGKTRLKIAYVEAGFGSDWLRVIATHFVKENPDYWLYLDGDPGLTELVSTQLSAGRNLADIYMPLAHDWQTYAINGWIEELSDVYNAKPDGEAGQTVYEKMDDTWKEYCVANDATGEGKYSYPWSAGVSGIAYNGKMFEQYGWQVPTTWDELLALCAKIKLDTNGKVAPFVYPGLIGGYFDFLGYTSWLQNTGIEGVKDFWTFPSAEVYNPEKQPYLGVKNALESFTELFGPNTGNALKGSMSKNHTEAQLSLLRGEAAMIINGSWLETEMIRDLPEGYEMRMMRIPYDTTAKKDENGEFVKINYGMTPDFMIIPKQAAQKEIAKKFLVFMAKDEMLKYFTKYTSTARPFKYDTAELRENLSAFANDCLDIYTTSENFIAVKKGPLKNINALNWYLTSSPFTLLVYGPENDGTTPDRFVRLQYQTAKGEWQRWLDSVG
ncbi:MAG: extracellular solute-binding protein [Clostridia bacterium]|nr:extracellular solute-binding protein [Clostridia bacterium]